MGDVIAEFITKTLPAYLAELPVPSTLEGWTKLTKDEWVAMAPVIFVVVMLFLHLAMSVIPSKPKPSRVNSKVDLSSAKVVNKVGLKDIEDTGKNGVFCRCWKSSKFPYCDGTHAKHNEKCGDNVGPLIITQPEKK